MCLIAFAHHVVPEYPLVLIANRDEFYERPTRKAQRWQEEGFPDLVAGKDLKAGGTWMAVQKGGKWAALTNYRDLQNFMPDAPSRGNLVLDFLKTTDAPFEYLKEVKSSGKSYNGFNLLVGNGKSVYHYSNISNQIKKVGEGIHGVSNALLDTPWPKLEESKKDLQKHLENPILQEENLFKILADETKAKDTELPATGLDYEKEKAVSSIFVRTKDYGTRCSTILLLDQNFNVHFKERTFDPQTKRIVNEIAFDL